MLLPQLGEYISINNVSKSVVDRCARGKGSVMVANKFRDLGCLRFVVDRRGLLDGFD